MIQPLTIPGLFITGTDLGVGKTVLAGAIANWFARRKKQVGVCKIVATGCERRREGLVSADAEFLAVCAGSKHPLDLIAPQRWAEDLPPAVAAERSKQSVDWFVINNAIRLMSQNSEVMVVEGVGGLMTPMDARHTMLDVAKALGVPTVVVTRPAPGAISHTLLTINALRQADVKLAGVVINRYPTDVAPLIAEATPRAIEKWGRVPVLSILPEEPTRPDPSHLPKGIIAAIEQVDWDALTRR